MNNEKLLSMSYMSIVSMLDAIGDRSKLNEKERKHVVEAEQQRDEIEAYFRGKYPTIEATYTVAVDAHEEREPDHAATPKRRGRVVRFLLGCGQWLVIGFIAWAFWNFRAG
jgi:hypothetical protein